jgi:predicted  nucleic acid-binding Zn-ribbon protein
MFPEHLERTIDFILQSQARAEARQEKAEARQDKLDRRVDSIATIVKQGMRLLAKSEKENSDARIRQRKLDKTVSEMATQVSAMATRVSEIATQQKAFRADVGRALAQLAQAQKATEQRLQVFINSMRGSRNGH